jgi:hypothetical protein
MGSRVWYEATVACGIPGCPWKIKVEGPDEQDAMERLQRALREHSDRTHSDGSGDATP